MADQSNTAQDEKREAQRARYRARYAANPEYYRERARRWHEENRDRSRAKSAEWRTANPEKVKQANREAYAADKDAAKRRYAEWKENNRAARAAYMQKWREDNPDKASQYSATRAKSVQFRLENAVRCRIWTGITRGSKRGRRTRDILPFSIDELMAHLERQFLPKMSWDNYGKWHIDHIIPLSSFEYSTPDDPDFSAAWSLNNLRPLWASDNLAKSSRRTLLL